MRGIGESSGFMDLSNFVTSSSKLKGPYGDLAYKIGMQLWGEW